MIDTYVVWGLLITCISIILYLFYDKHRKFEEHKKIYDRLESELQCRKLAMKRLEEYIKNMKREIIK